MDAQSTKSSLRWPALEGIPPTSGWIVYLCIDISCPLACQHHIIWLLMKIGKTYQYLLTLTCYKPLVTRSAICQIPVMEMEINTYVQFCTPPESSDHLSKHTRLLPLHRRVARLVREPHHLEEVEHCKYSIGSTFMFKSSRKSETSSPLADFESP